MLQGKCGNTIGEGHIPILTAKVFFIQRNSKGELLVLVSARAAYRLCDCQIPGVFRWRIHWRIWSIRIFLQSCIEIIYNISCSYSHLCSSI